MSVAVAMATLSMMTIIPTAMSAKLGKVTQIVVQLRQRQLR